MNDGDGFTFLLRGTQRLLDRNCYTQAQQNHLGEITSILKRRYFELFWGWIHCKFSLCVQHCRRCSHEDVLCDRLDHGPVHKFMASPVLLSSPLWNRPSWFNGTQKKCHRICCSLGLTQDPRVQAAASVMFLLIYTLTVLSNLLFTVMSSPAPLWVPQCTSSLPVSHSWMLLIPLSSHPSCL